MPRQVVLLVILIGTLVPQGAGAAKLVFKSGFERGVALLPTKTSPVQGIVGRDRKTRFAFPIIVGGFEGGKFNYLVTKKAPLQYVETRIDTVPSPSGARTRALYQCVKGDDPDMKAHSRNQYNLLMGSVNQAYIRYQIRLQPDLA